MKRKIVGCLLTMCLFVFFTSGMASAKFLNDWKLDIDGAGSLQPVVIDELLDIVGFAYIINTLNGSSSGTFEDYGVFVSRAYDSGTLFPWVNTYELTAKLHLSGDIILVPEGLLTFTDGTLDIYADNSGLPFSDDSSQSDGIIYGANDGTLIASFDLQSGSGTVDPTGVPNGQMTITLKATYLAPGIWFDEDDRDLSTLDPQSLLFGFSTTNASYVENPTDAVVNEIAGEFAGVSDPANQPPGDLFVSPNGQFRLVIEEEEEEECRVTAGGVERFEDDGEIVTLACSLKPNGKPDPKTCALQNVDGSSIKDTWGGQAGASGIDGNWTHHHQVSPQESFVFHSNNVTWIQCSDPGIPCTPAGANAETRQIDFKGIGTFVNQKGFDFPTGNVGFTVHLEDIGEPGPGGKWPSSETPCTHIPGTPIENDPDCMDCTDYYEIRIYDNIECTGDPIYVNGSSIMGSDLEGYFITSGNVQMHPGK